MFGYKRRQKEISLQLCSVQALLVSLVDEMNKKKLINGNSVMDEYEKSLDDLWDNIMKERMK